MDKAFYPPLVKNVPPQYSPKGLSQQATQPLTFTAFKQTIFSGGLNGTVGTTRSVTLRSKTHISFFHWSIKGAPSAIVEIKLYANINGVTKQIITHGMPIFPSGTGQGVNDEEYQDRVYNFDPPIILEPVRSSDTLSVSCDGGSDGYFTLVFYEEPK